ncbi:hypothetical protein OSB04_015568 [Centaurea solstitialis]|uniref:Fe2OG dioxygenase domain-containing protein n=1 Tax=Centaurea solstitialis TaxID=347529 RepID=A0AA38T747_9ASTR|nr:hypothetical protein OSB04_015568 [Centaurea solstitialis]
MKTIVAMILLGKMAKVGVPVIDMQKVDGLGEALVKACVEWGCFRMVNHGVSVELMAEMKAVTASLLDLPEEIKRRTISTEQGKGYIERNPGTPFFETLSVDDIMSHDEFCDRLDASPQQRHSGIEPTNDYHKHTYACTPPRWYRASMGSQLIRRCPDPTYAEPKAQPQSLIGLGQAPTLAQGRRFTMYPIIREVIYEYIKAIRDLAELLGRKLMEGSGLVGDLFDGWCCQLRMNKYHYCPESVGLSGVGLHSDPTFLTILQDDENVNGLQVVDKYSGESLPFDPVPGSLAVNVGDIAKAWSNGRFYSVKHRVTCFEPKTRYSIVLFVLGPNGTKVEAPSELVDSEHPRLYVPIDIKEYRNVRTSKRLHIGNALDLFRSPAT